MMTPLDRNSLPDEPMTEQEIFDAVVAHAATMDEPCEVDGECRYRNDKGGACFVGALMSNAEVYDLTGQPVWELKEIGRLPARLDRVDVRFLEKLQDIHDMHPTVQWPDQFREFASDHGLTFTDYTEDTA